MDRLADPNINGMNAHFIPHPAIFGRNSHRGAMSLASFENQRGKNRRMRSIRLRAGVTTYTSSLFCAIPVSVLLAQSAGLIPFSINLSMIP